MRAGPLRAARQGVTGISDRVVDGPALMKPGVSRSDSGAIDQGVLRAPVDRRPRHLYRHVQQTVALHARMQSVFAMPPSWLQAAMQS
jgi:hypothetical protein